MPEPLVSVILPAYQGERFLAEAIDSALGQDYPHVEVIVVDDGSTDASADIARARGVRLIEQANLGVSAARNTGLAAARGDLIAFLDQDDYFAPDKLTTQVACLTAEPELDFVLGGLRIVLKPGTPKPNWWDPAWDEAGAPGAQLGVLLARRELIDAIGGFDTRYEIAGDTDWLARAKDAGASWRRLPQVAVYYRLHNTNASYDIDLLRAELLRVLRASVVRRRAAGGGA